MSESMKVFELAKALDIKALDLIEKIKPLDLKIKNHMADLDAEQIARIKEFLNPPSATDAAPKKRVVRKAAASDSSKAPKAVVVRTRRKSSDEGEDLPETANAAAAPAEEIDEPAPTPRRNVVVRREMVDEDGQPIVPEEPKAAEPVFVAPELPSAPIVPAAPVASDKDEAVEGDLKDAFTEEMFTQPRVIIEEVVEPEPEVVAAAPAGETPVAPGAPAPRRLGSRYSVIRVVNAEPAKRDKPLIVKDADPAEVAKMKAQQGGTRSFGDGDAPRGPNFLAEIEKDEEALKKKGASAPKVRTTTDASIFKSTDFLRRERVYQPKKKRLLIGRGSAAKSGTAPSGLHKRYIEFHKEISVEDFAHQASLKAKEVARKLVSMGVEYPDEAETLAEWMLDLETAQILAGEFHYELRDETPHEDDILDARGHDKEAEGELRDPVITIMGHVDHGKTSLLDLIRRARVVSGEAGGITQHIGAYTVRVEDAVSNLQAFMAEAEGGKKDKKDKKKDRAAEAPAKKAKGAAAKEEGTGKPARLTFLDTPGHAAFSAIRSRGAKATDIVILVVAASEGVMPQTREAVDHAKAAGVPIIVAMNKMDLPDANPDKIRQQLSEVGLISEEWGGDTLFVPVSAKTGLGVDKLLELLQLQAELLDLRARHDGFADGIIIEAKLDKARGPLATVIVQNGTLKVGDYISAGEVYGKVRALLDDKGGQLKEAGPSTPVEIMGLSSVPEAGDALNAVEDERAARGLAEMRTEQRRKQDANATIKSVEEIYALMAQGNLKELPVLLKADVKGSAEAIQGSLQKLPQNKVRLKILSTAVGGVSENDVLLASASKAIIIGFNVRPDPKALAASERMGVPIKTYTIIYNLVDDVSNAMVGLLEPVIKEIMQGQAQVREVFTISKVGAVAGCMVTSGKIQRSNTIRVVRDGRIMYTGKMSGLKRFKDDAKEVAKDFECGISIESFNDIKPGDILEAFIEEKSVPTLDGTPSGAKSANA